MRTVFLDSEDTKVETEKDAFCKLKIYEDYSFDQRGILYIEVTILDTGITMHHSFTIPRIYNFVKRNKVYHNGYGTITLYNSVVESFKTFDSNNLKQIITLIDISESLDNVYITNKK